MRLVLTRYRDFRWLFAGNSVSLLGSSVTAVALPLTAVVYLHASPAQMGVLGAVALLPHLVLGLPAGVWVDRDRVCLPAPDAARAARAAGERRRPPGSLMPDGRAATSLSS